MVDLHKYVHLWICVNFGSPWNRFHYISSIVHLYSLAHSFKNHTISPSNALLQSGTTSLYFSHFATQKYQNTTHKIGDSAFSGVVSEIGLAKDEFGDVQDAFYIMLVVEIII